MGLVTNDEALITSEGERLVDAHTVLDESNPLVLAHPEAFHSVPPAADEGVARTSAVYADPNLQTEDQPPVKNLPKTEEDRETRLAAAQASPPVVPTDSPAESTAKASSKSTEKK